MDRLLPPTRRVAIALTLTAVAVIGCQRSSEIANQSEKASTRAPAPHLFHAPEDVRPMAQLAAHLSISETHENIVANPHVRPHRIPPVTPDASQNDESPLETVRFPIKIERSTQPEQSTKPQQKAYTDEVPERLPATPPAQFNTAQVPLALNPPSPADTQAQPQQQVEEVQPHLVDLDLPDLLEPQHEASSSSERNGPQQSPAPSKTIEPNYLRDLPPAGRFTHNNESPTPTIEKQLPSVTGPPASFISLAPASSKRNPALIPNRQVIEDLEGPGLSVPAPTQPILPAPQRELPPRKSAHEINHALIAVRGRMNSLVDHGLVLAQRGAYYSSRAEFIQALRLATQTLDTAEKTHRHSDALAEAVAALDEAGDFIPQGARLEANVDLDLVVSSHRTPVLKGQNLQYETTLTATQKYFSFAQEKLIIACGNLPETSRALVGLGRIQEYLYGSTGDNRTLIGPRSIALFQTALAVDQNNFEAANELGVLLARYGQFDEAKQALLQGVQSSPRPEIWQNLASIHETLGETEMARRAQQEAEMAQQYAQLNGDLNAVRWVTPEEMARHGQAADVNLQQSAPSANIPPIAQRRSQQSTR